MGLVVSNAFWPDRILAHGGRGVARVRLLCVYQSTSIPLLFESSKNMTVSCASGGSLASLTDECTGHGRSAPTAKTKGDVGTWPLAARTCCYDQPSSRGKP